MLNDRNHYCRSCQNVLEKRDRFCRKCGTKKGEGTFNPNYKKESDDKMISITFAYKCMNCKKEWTSIMTEAKFCPKCGKISTYVEEDDDFEIVMEDDDEDEFDDWLEELLD